MKATSGGIGAQWLRDPRVYPDDRRKVPAFINADVREHMPANYYELHASTHSGDEFDAWYIDQRSAFHNHAKRLELPDANSLFAHSTYNLGTARLDTSSDSFFGLYYLRLGRPKTFPAFTPWPRSAFARSEIISAFVFTNEIGFLRDHGYILGPGICAWGSVRKDTGLARYARIALGELERIEDNGWLKPILLATYGVLATTPRAMLGIRNTESPKSRPITLYTRRGELAAYLVGNENGNKLEPGVANVLHLAMIQAEVRIESCSFANYLEYLGYKVLSIYADAVIVQNDGELPEPSYIEPWRLQTALTHLQFDTPQRFTSSEMDRLPGTASRNRNSSRGTVGKSNQKLQKVSVIDVN